MGYMPSREGHAETVIPAAFYRPEIEMAQISKQIRHLATKWKSGQGWPKRLEWIEVEGVRGWTGQRVDFAFPITAIVGENGSGKSTLLQAAAATYISDGSDSDTWFASDFFPNTAWDEVKDAKVRFGYRQGQDHKAGSIRKPTTKWLGNLDRPRRHVSYIDLSRIQPVSARSGYMKIVRSRHVEASSRAFEKENLVRFSHVMGREYDVAKLAKTDIDPSREIPVIGKGGTVYSGFHQGSGEVTVAELLGADFKKGSLVLIDEIESSLHPRTQRRLIRELADICRDRDIQVVLTTHSPFILEELPPEARTFILQADGVKKTVTGVTSLFAMTQMDDHVHPEFDLYVEDMAARTLLSELLALHASDMFVRSDIVPCGAASVAQALGIMTQQKRFRRPTVVFIDGDQPPSAGCTVLPGGDAPERVVFDRLGANGWAGISARIARSSSAVADALSRATTITDHHEWVALAAAQLKCSPETLWQSMCAEWAKLLEKEEVNPITEAIAEATSSAV